MTTEQRKDCVSTFEKTKLSRSATQSGEEACMSDPPEAMSSKHPPSVSAEDSGIATIPLDFEQYTGKGFGITYP